jgi:hypothetical protein
MKEGALRILCGGGNGQKINPLRAGPQLVNLLRGHVGKIGKALPIFANRSGGILAGEFFPYS